MSITHTSPREQALERENALMLDKIRQQETSLEKHRELMLKHLTTIDPLRAELAQLKATVTRLEGEAGVMRLLLQLALGVIENCYPDDSTEAELMMDLQNKIVAAVKGPTIKQSLQVDLNPQCTCLINQLGPHYCEVHAA